jgi:Undecaprenyl-phosphate galactose phosphotransferase WbaP
MNGTARLRRLRTGMRPLATALALAGGDLLALVIAMLAAIYLRKYYDGRYDPIIFIRLWPVLFLFLGTFGTLGLYFGIAPGPADELRRITYGCVLVFLGLAAITYLTRTGDVYSRGVYTIALGLAIVGIPLMRVLVRNLGGRCRWWGQPAVIIGCGPVAQRVCRSLLAQPGLGLRPVAMLDPDGQAGEEVAGIPRLDLGMARQLAAERHLPYAIIAMPEGGRDRLLRVIEEEKELFPHLVIIPDFYGFSSLWVEAKDIGGMLGLEVARRLLLPWPRFLKRGLDLAVALGAGICLLPVFALVAAAILATSRGPVFYGQRRIGMGGRHFRAWKFRSMVRDADALLAHHLAAHPEHRDAWERDHKLKDDPRVTAIGRLLRKTSLDELPQLWNVLIGQMSLVGPRPIVDDEMAKYGDQFTLYLRVRPGMTGMWQVSGRSDTGYAERVGYDAYYVRNWSVWLDLYLIARTVKVVLLGRGAY